MMDKDQKKFYSIQELTKILSVGRSTLYAAVTAGKIPAKRLGTRILIPASYVNEFIQQ